MAPDTFQIVRLLLDEERDSARMPALCELMTKRHMIDDIAKTICEKYIKKDRPVGVSADRFTISLVICTPEQYRQEMRDYAVAHLLKFITGEK